METLQLLERLRVLEESFETARQLVHRHRHRRHRLGRSASERDLVLVRALQPLVRGIEERLEALAVAAEGVLDERV